MPLILFVDTTGRVHGRFDDPTEESAYATWVHQEIARLRADAPDAGASPTLAAPLRETGLPCPTPDARPTPMHNHLWILSRVDTIGHGQAHTMLIRAPNSAAARTLAAASATTEGSDAWTRPTRARCALATTDGPDGVLAAAKRDR